MTLCAGAAPKVEDLHEIFRLQPRIGSVIEVHRASIALSFIFLLIQNIYINISHKLYKLGIP